MQMNKYQIDQNVMDTITKFIVLQWALEKQNTIAK